MTVPATRSVSRGVDGWTISTAVLVFSGYLLFLPPIPYWLDAPEFIAAGWNLGQAHPPGHPAVLMVLKAFLLIPVGEAAFRANLFSAVFGAVSAGLVCRIVQVVATEMRWTMSRDRLDRAARPRPGHLVPGVAGIAAGLGTGWSLSSVLQSLSVEVYTLNAALVLAALATVVSAGRGPGGGEGVGQTDRRVVGPIALLLALGLGNHHFLIVLAFPALAVGLVRRNRWHAASLVATGAVLIAATGLMYAYLWARGAAGAWPAWADTSSLDGVWWVASARLFSESLGGFDDPVSGIAGNLGKAIALLATDFSPAGVVLAAGGLYLCIRSGRVRAAVVLALLIAGSLASKVSMGILDPHNPDDHGYFLGAVAGVAILQGLFGAGLIGLAAEIPLSRPGRWGVGTLGAAVLASTALVPPAMSLPVAVERAALRDPVEVSRLVWDEQPPRSVLFLSHYPVYFQAMHGQVVEGARPDVTLVQSSLYRKARGGRFYAERLRREDPDLGGLVQGFLRDKTMSAPEVARLAARRPVRFDAEDEPVMPGLGFGGWTLEVVVDAPDAGRSPPEVAGGGEGAGQEVVARVEEHVRRLRRSVPWPLPAGRVDGGPDRSRTPDIETRRVLLRHLVSMARTLAALGHRRAAARLVETALEMNPLDRQVRAMAADLATPRDRP